jgi:hypothetical protein
MKFMLMLLFSLSVVASEVDQYTYADQPISDITIELNQRANEYLAKAIQTANKKKCTPGQRRSEKRLYKAMKKYFANYMKGQLIKDILYTNDFEKRVIPAPKSIFKDWSASDGLVMRLHNNKEDAVTLSPIIKMAGLEFGSDKLEHMFGMGHIYFNNFYHKKRPLHKVLQNGIVREKLFLGGNLLTTGIFSYGDLVANFQGMRFWNAVLKNNKDVLGADIGPYVECDRGQYVQVGEIDFSVFIDKGLDERVNCSKFATNVGYRKYTRNARRVLALQGKEFSCPSISPQLDILAEKYSMIIGPKKLRKPLWYWLINNESNGKVNIWSELKD